MSLGNASASERVDAYNKYELLGLPINKWDYKAQKGWKAYYNSQNESDSEYYPPNPKYDLFSISPIELKDNATNDIYNLYFKNGFNAGVFWHLAKDKNIYKQENGVWSIKDDYRYKDYLLLELVSKGKTFERGIEVERGKTIISELDTLDGFDDKGKAKNYAEIYADDPLVSNAKPQFDIADLVLSQIEKGEKLLQESKDILFELSEAKDIDALDDAMWSVSEIDKLYNTQISNDDKRAFLIWLQNRNEKELEGEFADMYGSAFPTPANVIIELMTKGNLFYVPNAPLGERLQPKVIYLSGNIWGKWSVLQSEKEKNDFIDRFGEELHQQHIDVLRPVWQETWEQRLRVKPEDKSMRMVLLPISEMAREVKVNSFISVSDRDAIKKQFEIYTKFSKGEIESVDYNLDRSDFEKSSNNFIKKESISLKEAFILWCKDAGEGDRASKFGVQWSAKTKNVKLLIERYLDPIQNPYGKDKKKGSEKWATQKDDARKVGQRLFQQFLEDGIDAEQQRKIEILWNSTYNFYREPELEQVPIGFTYKKYLDNINLFVLREANLKALRYYLSRGSVGLAYGVGIGKTFCSIMVMKQALDLGLCKRPLVAVPNQVYFQFAKEIQRGLGKDFLPTSPNSRLNMFYNGSGDYNVMGNNAVDGINLCTYQAVLKMQFEKEKIFDEEQGLITADWLEKGTRIITQGTEQNTDLEMLSKSVGKSFDALFNDFEDNTDKTDEDGDEESKSTEETENSDEELLMEDGGQLYAKGGGVPKVLEPIFINSDTTGYDMVCVDEAHNFNALFSKVFAGIRDKQTGKTLQRDKNPYTSIRETSSGKEASSRAKKLFWITRYVQSKSQIKNTMLLSATPFTNSPTQVFNLLAILDYDMLEEHGVGIMKDFYDLFAKVEYAEDFRTNLTIVKREKLTGWVNIIPMQRIVFRVFDKSTREQEDRAIIRPEKIVLPLKRIMENGKTIEMASENHVSTTIKLSQLQRDLWEEVRKYSTGGDDAPTYEQICSPEKQNTTSFGKYAKPKKQKKANEEDEDTELDIENPDDLSDGTQDGEKAKNGAKALQCLMWGRQLCLNPYLFKCAGFKQEPTPREYVEASPKMLYVMECIRSVKEYHEKEGSVQSGQVIYMNFGVKGFTMLRDYLVEEIGYEMNEIAIISSQNYIGKKRYTNKVDVQDRFLGRTMNSETGEYCTIPENERAKILIGSEAIKEGINLQDYASTLYNVFLDFNPTDQVQVEGRIWRQGNAFGNVRIVVPLMADCIDVFMFQKLGDKTERINQLWTRSGNKNELDTTAFDPQELKFELMTDPKAIAILERESRVEKLDEKIVEEMEVRSNLISLENLFEKHQKVATPNLMGYGQSNFLTQAYYFLSTLRPDLITKPFYDQKAWEKYLGKLNAKTESPYSLDTTMERMITRPPTDLEENDPLNIWSRENYLEYQSQADTLFGILNYSAKDLIDLIVLFNKQQKIAFPRGYSKNWRDLIEKDAPPIMEGDMVEYDTRKGRKKGKVTYAEKGKRRVLEDRLDEFNFGKNDLQWIKDDFTKSKFNTEKLKSKDDRLDMLLNLGNKGIEEIAEFIDEKDGKNIPLIKNFMYYLIDNEYQYDNGGYDNDDNAISVKDDYLSDNVTDWLTPDVVDIDDTEGISVYFKNVKLIVKEKSAVKPTKYPEPYTWTNNNALEYLNDSNAYLEYISQTDFDKYKMPQTKSTHFLRNAGNFWEWVIAEAEGNKNYLAIGESSYYRPLINLIFGNYHADFFKQDAIKRDYSLFKTWIEVQDQLDSYYGAYSSNGSKWYYTNFAKTIADFKVAQRDILEPQGLKRKSDVTTLMLASKEKVNALVLEQQQLFDDQVFEELIQEVIRKQNALQEEEIREGNSFRARALQFATPNPEYMGNKYLSEFMVSEKAKRDSRKCIDAEVIEEITQGQQEILDEIEEYKELMEFQSEEEQKITQDDINDLMELYDFA